MFPASLHQALLESISSKVQLPLATGNSKPERARKILYFHGSEELSLALRNVQGGVGELYPAKNMMNRRLADGKKFKGIWKNYGFGAIVNGAGLDKPRQGERDDAIIYTNRLVPGGFMLIWGGQFRSPSRFDMVQKMYTMRMETELLVPKITHGLDRAILRSLNFNPDDLPPYFIARKPQQ